MNDRFGLETAEAKAGVSLSNTQQDQLLLYVDLLRRWQKAQNLVAPSTIDDVWERHICDALQLVPLIAAWASERTDNQDNKLEVNGLDLGSGGGLPAVVLAIALSQVRLTLVEANARKGAFLRTVSRETGVPFRAETARIEALHDNPAIRPDFITARALAPLDRLMKLAEPWVIPSVSAFFHKGGETARELAEWPDAAQYNVVEHPSVVDPNSRILQISRRES